jgi:t-SNARE syntaxin family protein
LSDDLADLVQSVRAIEQDPYKFGVELDEIERRRRLVEEVGGELEDMREELGKTIHDAQAKGKGNMLPDPDTFDEDEDGYTVFEQERQQEIMAEQDEALDGVFRTVGNLRTQADAMGRELEEQGEILHEVDTITDRVGGKIQSGIQKVGWVIKKNEGQWLCSFETND